jgi:hypothetical protein
MRTVIYGEEPIFAWHMPKEEGNRTAVVVDADGKEVNVVFSENETPDREFDYNDWIDLDEYNPKTKTADKKKDIVSADLDQTEEHW